MIPQRQEMKGYSDAGTQHKAIVDLDEIIEKWVSVNRRHISIYGNERAIQQVCVCIIWMIGLEDVGIIEAKSRRFEISS